MRGCDDEDELLDSSDAEEERAIKPYRQRSGTHKLVDDLRDLWLWVVHPILEQLGCLVSTL